MRYRVTKFGNALSDAIPLLNVVHAMAVEQASRATGKFHRPTFDGVFPTFVDHLERDAATGILDLCDSRGLAKSFQELVESNPKTMDLHVIHFLYSKTAKLSSWAQKSGDEIDYFDVKTDIQEFGPGKDGTMEYQGYVLPSLDPPINYKKLAERKTAKVTVESVAQRRARYLAWFIDEERINKRGALQRVLERELKQNPKADRSNIGKDIAKARSTATTQKTSNVWISQLVQDGKRRG